MCQFQLQDLKEQRQSILNKLYICLWYIIIDVDMICLIKNIIFCINKKYQQIHLFVLILMFKYENFVKILLLFI